MGYQIITFLLISGFYGVYFAKQMKLRKKGIAADRLAKGEKPQRTAAIEKYLLAATYGTAIIQYASVFFSRYMLEFALPAVLRSAGIALIGGGVVFFVLAVTAMRDSWRAGVDESQTTAIITSGVYKISRNPAFVGFDLMYIGTALALPNAIMAIAALISVVLMHLQILEEERYLPRAFGEEYLRYKQSVPRYLAF